MTTNKTVLNASLYIFYFLDISYLKFFCNELQLLLMWSLLPLYSAEIERDFGATDMAIWLFAKMFNEAFVFTTNLR